MHDGNFGGRHRPHSIETERAVLAMVLARVATVADFAPLEARHFHIPLHGRIWQAMIDLTDLDREITRVAIERRLGGGAFDLNPFADLERVAFKAEMPTPRELVRDLLGLHAHRGVVDIFEQCLDASFDGRGRFIDHAVDLRRRLDDAIRAAAPMDMHGRSADAAADALLRSWDEPAPPRVTTGIPEFDARVGGLGLGEYTIMAARPSMGKSAVAVHMALAAARAGHGVCVFSLEMPERAWLARSWSCYSFLEHRGKAAPTFSSILRRTFDRGQREHLGQVREELRGLPMHIDDTSKLTMAEITARTMAVSERMKEQGVTLDLVVIDYLGKVAAGNRYKGNKVNEVGEISNDIAALAKTQNVAVLALHQLSRKVEDRENQRPVMSDLRDSGNLEQDADVVLFPFRPAYELERQTCKEDADEQKRQILLAESENHLEIQVAKNRSGDVPNVQCEISIAHCAIMPRQASAPPAPARHDPSRPVYSVGGHTEPGEIPF